MTARVLTDSLPVPANASRFLTTAPEALEQPEGTVQLAWDDDDPYLYNASFDGELIQHDDSYCTTVVDLDGVDQVPTMTYVFDALRPHLERPPKVLDIGCGQGEFVEALRRQGVDAVGYDPVVRRAAPYLHAKYFEPGVESADVFVMRCVLPHIPRPWAFLDDLAQAHPGALVLVEFQRLEWIHQEKVWYQLSHDHVNLFELADFTARHDVVEHGTFAAGEWGWVLLRLTGERGTVPARPCPRAQALRDLVDHRRRALHGLMEHGGPLVPWGAAGKGTVLAHALRRAGADVPLAIDADPRRHGSYLEGSGVVVRGPEVLPSLARDAVLVVANPNHLGPVTERYGGRHRILTPALAAR